MQPFIVLQLEKLREVLVNYMCCLKSVTLTALKSNILTKIMRLTRFLSHLDFLVIQFYCPQMYISLGRRQMFHQFNVNVKHCRGYDFLYYKQKLGYKPIENDI